MLIITTLLATTQPAYQDLWTGGVGGYFCYRIPALVVCRSGTVLAFCEARRNSCRDDGDIDLMLRRSVDGGLTWGEPAILAAEEGDVTMGNPCPIVDRETGAVHLIYCRNNERAFYIRSDNEGVSWSAPRELTAELRGFPVDWRRCATGPGHGLQLGSGRLLVPVWLNGPGDWYRTGALVSDDLGLTWRAAGLVPDSIANCNEALAFERRDGSVYLTVRYGERDGGRAWSQSGDGGESWSPPERVAGLDDPTVQASLLPLPGTLPRVLFSKPDHPTERRNVTIRLSYDDGRTWPVRRRLSDDLGAYSDLALLPDGTILCLFENGTGRYSDKLSLARFTLEWVTDGGDAMGG